MPCGTIRDFLLKNHFAPRLTREFGMNLITTSPNVKYEVIMKNGEHIKVPVLYGSVERWKAILRDGFLRDKKRQIITPVIVFKRNTININETIPQDKLDANNPHLFYPFEKKYSQINRYDNLTTQIGVVSQREYYNVSFPDYITLSYNFIIWTSFIEQMNRIVERINYSDGAYWGNPEKMKSQGYEFSGSRSK